MASDALNVTLIDTEIAALKAGETVEVPVEGGRFKVRVWRRSERHDWAAAKADPDVDLVVTPHDLVDLQVSGRLLVSYRPRPVALRAERTGISSFEFGEWPPEPQARARSGRAGK